MRWNPTLAFRRTAVAAALVLAACALATAQERTSVETVALEPGGRLSVEASGGSVSLSAWDTRRVEVRARITAAPGIDGDCAGAAVDAVSIGVRQRDHNVEIRAERGDRPPECVGAHERRLTLVAFEIRAPRVLDLDLKVTQGEATVTGFNGDIRVEADQGRLRASHLTGEIRIDSRRGQLDASDLAGQVRIRVERGGGEVADVRGSLALEVSQGSLAMLGVRVDADSSAEVDRGGLDLGLVENQGLTIEGEAVRGDITVEAPSLARQRTHHGRVETTINGGGPTLRVAAHRGSVRLHSN